MRVQLVLVCVVVWLAVAWAHPRDRKGGRSGSGRSGEEGFRLGSGSGRREGPGSGSREGRLHTSLCALTSHGSGVVETVECREGATCSSPLVDFSVQGEEFSAAFCAREEREESSSEEEEGLTEEMLVLFMMHRACKVVNGSAEEERACPPGLTCSLGDLEAELEGHVLAATYCQDAALPAPDWLQVFQGRPRGGSSSGEGSRRGSGSGEGSHRGSDSGSSSKKSKSKKSSKESSASGESRAPKGGKGGRKGGKGGRKGGKGPRRG